MSAEALARRAGRRACKGSHARKNALTNLERAFGQFQAHRAEIEAGDRNEWLDGCYWNLSSQLSEFQGVVFDNSTVALPTLGNYH